MMKCSTTQSSPDDESELATLYTKREVAAWLGTSTRNVELQVKAGSFPAPIRLGTHPRWRKSDLLNWMEEQSSKEPAT